MQREAGFWCGFLKELVCLCRGMYCWLLRKKKRQLWPPSAGIVPSRTENFNLSREFFFSSSCFGKESCELGSYIRQHQAQTHFYLLAWWTQHGEILSVCICVCPSSPTTRQSIVMHVRWPIYSSHLLCVLGTWHWSSSPQCAFADREGHRPGKASNSVELSWFLYKTSETVILASAGSGWGLQTVFIQLAARPGFRCWMVSELEIQRSCLYFWHLWSSVHLSAILFWSVSAGWGVASSKQWGGGGWGCPWWSSALNTPCNQRSFLCHLCCSACPSFTSAPSPSP